MKLHELHIHQVSPGAVGERHPVAGVLPRIGSNLPRFANAAGGHDNRLGSKHHESPLLAPVSKRPGDAVSIFQQAGDRAFHVNVDSQLHAAVLQGADHFQPGAVPYVTQPAEGVTAKGALQDLPVLSTIKERSPLLQFPHTFGSFLGMDLRHAPVVEQLAAAHGVTKVSTPVVCGVHVSHRRGDATFRHNRMRFAEERFAYHAHFRALLQGAERCSQARAAGTDDQHIVLVSFVFSRHKSLKSVIAPLATSRTYRSVRPTVIRLIQA